jgi:hypothetical protein
MAFTGPFPKNDKLNMAAFRAAEIKRQGGGFKNAKAADSNDMGKRMTDDTAMDAYPSLKANKDGTGSHGGTVHTKAGAELTVPTKKRPFGHEGPMTGVPEGRALPSRGEGPTTNTGRTVTKNTT